MLGTLAPSDQPMLKQFGTYLKAKDETIFVLQQQVKTEQNKHATQEAIRNYEDTGGFGFCFHPQDLSDLLHTFVIPHIRDLDDQRYYYNLDMATVEPEDLSQAISMVVNLLQAVKNPIFQRNLRSNQVSTLPRELSSFDSKYYSKEQKEKDDALVELHKDFAPVLQVLLHTPSKLSGNPMTMSLLTHCFLSASTLPSIYVRCYFEFLGKTIAQPRRDLFEKTTGLSVSHSTRSCFLTRAESESAMATAWQHDLIGTHISAVRPNTFGGRGRGNGKNSRRGAKRGAGRGGSPASASPTGLALGSSVGPTVKL